MTMFKPWYIIGAMLVLLGSAANAAAAIITETEMIQAVQKEFVEQGVEDEIELEIYGGQNAFSIEDAEQAKIMITNLKYDAAQNKFAAKAEIFADGKPYAATTLNGRYYTLVEVPVPAKNIDKGTLISAEMLHKIKMRSNRLKENNLVDIDKLVGMEAKKSLKEGKVITDRDVGAAILIKKGKVVTSVYKAKGLQITALAEALENGAKGETIELENTKSGKKFRAKVIDGETVEIDG